MIYKILVSILLVSAITLCSNKKTNENKPSDVNKLVYANENKKAAGFTLTGTDGKIIKLSAFKGKIVIIDFWATWCPPCRRGIPDFIELQKEFGKDLVIIGISTDEQKSDVISFMKTIAINYPIVYGTREVGRLYGIEYGVDPIPHSFIIDKKGKVVGEHVGLVPKSEYTDQLKKLLRKGK
jgi:cytochrome c biogenesis protein CcmG/thiol:disulfide interchange protein DsbE